MLRIYKYLATLAIILGSLIIANAGDLNKNTNEDATITANAELTSEITADPEVFYWYDPIDGELLNPGMPSVESPRHCTGAGAVCALGYESLTPNPNVLTAEKIEREN